ncbi:MAG TPA: class I SAM-dependent rRNA methyltransferase [Stellaceae bacterium]|nr:class I SAM-dependent rRNA methyltransferase [Stellaceae bacterium]
MTDHPAGRPLVTLARGQERRARGGHPWIYSNEIVLDQPAKALPPGTLVTVAAADGRRLGVAMFNPHSLVGLRLIDRDPAQVIDREFLAGRLRRALILRDRLFGRPFYRLVHAEADGLPGLIVDRFGDALVCQLNTAGMALLEAELLAALDAVLAPAIIVLRNDTPARTLEGLPLEERIVKGRLDGPLPVEENGARFLADPRGGQKTGWFYDQRPNRAAVAALSRGTRVLDVYSFTGGFGIQAALAGASTVTALDRSEAALLLATDAALVNGVADRFRTLRGEAFETLQQLSDAAERFDVVILDPPAFAKSKKDLAVGLRGYRKLVRLGAGLVSPGGVMFAASCSHNVSVDAFAEAVRQGLGDADRTGRILATTGAGPDHPVHPALPESAYLKGQLLAVD